MTATRLVPRMIDPATGIVSPFPNDMIGESYKGAKWAVEERNGEVFLSVSHNEREQLISIEMLKQLLGVSND